MTSFIIYIKEKTGRIKNGEKAGPGHITTVFLLILLLFIGFISSNLTRAYSESFWQEQQEKARHAVEKEPESLTANYQLAVTMANLGQIKKIDQKLNEFSDEVDKEKFAEEIKPFFADNPEDFDKLLILNFEAYYHVILEDYSQAAEIFADIIELDDKNIWARNFQAAVHIENGEPDTAQELLYENLEIEKEDYTYFLLGYVNYEEGRLLRALKYLSRARRVIFDLVF